MENFFQKNTLFFFLIFVCGLFLGWFLFHKPVATVESSEKLVVESSSALWTCPSHPEIRKGQAGQCPICSTSLIPMEENDDDAAPSVVRFSNGSDELAKITTTLVTKQSPMKDISIYGKVQADEFVVQKQRAPISGRLDKMMVNSTGVSVAKGQKLALIYSPEFVSAQQELLEAANNKTVDPATYEEAKSRLLKFGLDQIQISAIEKRDRVQINTEVVSSISGIVTSRKMNDGEYVKKGSVIYEVADLSKVWILFDVSDSDLPFIKKGDQISFTVKSLQGTTLKGNIEYIYPGIDPKTQMSKVRLEFDNTSGLLKPDMHTTGIVRANFSQYIDELVVPQSAIVKSNDKYFVYVKQVVDNETVFTPRTISLGSKLGDSYVVTGGISEGEELILQGTATLRQSNSKVE